MFTNSPSAQRASLPLRTPRVHRSSDGRRRIFGRPAMRSKAAASAPWLISPRQALILAVACERLAFGLLASLLVFQLSERWGLTESRAAAWVGYFLAASYMTPLLGGVLCDRGLGAHTACLAGCLSLALGYAALLSHHPIALLLGSGLVLSGSGLFRPGVQLLLDRLLPPASSGNPAENPQRDEVYAAMHAIVNIGGMVAPLLSDGLRRSAGWATVSGMAVGCMLVSLILLTRGIPQRARQKAAASSPPALHPEGERGDTGTATTGPLPAPPRASLRTLLALSFGLIGFWMVYAQSASTVLLWAKSGVDRRLALGELPVSLFAALPWALVVVLTPPLLSLLRGLRLRHREPSALARLRFGFWLLSAACLVLAVSASSSFPPRLSAMGTPPAHLAWLLASLFLITLGELCVAPLGPAIFLLHSPKALRGLAVALWFGTLGIGMLGGGALSELWGQLPPAAFFALCAALCLLARMGVTERLLSLGKS